jgi:hypothetical protein
VGVAKGSGIYAIFMDFHEISWILMNIHDFHEISRNFMQFHGNMLKCTNPGHPGRLAARNTGARARPGLGLSKSIVIPKDLLRNPVGRRLSLRLAQPLG